MIQALPPTCNNRSSHYCSNERIVCDHSSTFRTFTINEMIGKRITLQYSLSPWATFLPASKISLI